MYYGMHLYVLSSYQLKAPRTNGMLSSFDEVETQPLKTCMYELFYFYLLYLIEIMIEAISNLPYNFTKK